MPLQVVPRLCGAEQVVRSLPSCQSRSLLLPGFKSNSSSQGELQSVVGMTHPADMSPLSQHAQRKLQQHWQSDVLSNQPRCSKQSSLRRPSPPRGMLCGHESPRNLQMFSQSHNAESDRYHMTGKSTMVPSSPRILQRSMPEARLRVLSPESSHRALSPQTISRQVSCTHKQMHLPQLSPRTCNRDITLGSAGAQVGTNATCVVQQNITITSTVHVHSS